MKQRKREQWRTIVANGKTFRYTYDKEGNLVIDGLVLSKDLQEIYKKLQK